MEQWRPAIADDTARPSTTPSSGMSTGLHDSTHSRFNTLGPELLNAYISKMESTAKPKPKSFQESRSPRQTYEPSRPARRKRPPIFSIKYRNSDWKANVISETEGKSRPKSSLSPRTPLYPSAGPQRPHTAARPRSKYSVRHSRLLPSDRQKRPSTARRPGAEQRDIQRDLRPKTSLGYSDTAAAGPRPMSAPSVPQKAPMETKFEFRKDARVNRPSSQMSVDSYSSRSPSPLLTARSLSPERPPSSMQSWARPRSVSPGKDTLQLWKRNALAAGGKQEINQSSAGDADAESKVPAGFPFDSLPEHFSFTSLDMVRAFCCEV